MKGLGVWWWGGHFGKIAAGASVRRGGGTLIGSGSYSG